MRNQEAKSKLDAFSKELMDGLEYYKVLTAKNSVNPLQLTEEDLAVVDADLMAFASSKDRSYFLKEEGEEKIARGRQIIWNKLGKILKHYVAESVKVGVDPEHVFKVLARMRMQFAGGVGYFGAIRTNGGGPTERVLGATYWLSQYDPARDNWVAQREAIFENANNTCNRLESIGVNASKENVLYRCFEDKAKKLMEKIERGSGNFPHQWFFVKDGFTGDGYYAYAICSTTNRLPTADSSGNTVKKFHLCETGDKIAYLGDYYVEFDKPVSAIPGESAMRSPHYVLVVYPDIDASYNQALLFRSYRYLTTDGLRLDDSHFLEKLAEFAYLFSNMLPYRRGGSAIGEWLIHGLAEAKGIELGPFNHNKGIGWDWQAFLIPLSDYLKEFPTHFAYIRRIMPTEEHISVNSASALLECTLFGKSPKTDGPSKDSALDSAGDEAKKPLGSSGS